MSMKKNDEKQALFEAMIGLEKQLESDRKKDESRLKYILIGLCVAVFALSVIMPTISIFKHSLKPLIAIFLCSYAAEKIKKY